MLTSEYEGKKIDFVIFTGVAGAARGFLKQWDIVISESAVQHDMDARPLFGQYVIPIINQKFLKPNQNFLKSVFQVLLKAKDNGKLKKYGKIYKGLIATGDKFISDKKIIENLYNDFPEILAVEMEGAAFAQVASQEGIKWIILRTISDSADESADTNFNSFLNDYEIYSWDLIESLLLFFNFHTMNN